MKTRLNFLGMIVGFGMVLVSAASANAVVLTSSNFSLGYGFYGGTWNNVETASTNVGLLPGDFAVGIILSGPALSTNGPIFTNKVLGNATGSNTYVGYTDGTSRLFQISTAANYTGLIPEGATNIQIQLNITSISVYVGRIAASDNGNSAAFVETTVGHQASQGPIILTAFTNITLASDYSLLDWNPSDYASSGTYQSRTFSLDAFGPSLGRVALDGFNVEGFVTLSYDVVPEPNTVMLLFGSLGLVILVRLRSKRVAA